MDLTEARERQDRAIQVYRLMENLVTDTSADLLRLELLEILDEHPTLKGVLLEEDWDSDGAALIRASVIPGDGEDAERDADEATDQASEIVVWSVEAAKVMVKSIGAEYTVNRRDGFRAKLDRESLVREPTHAT